MLCTIKLMNEGKNLVHIVPRNRPNLSIITTREKSPTDVESQTSTPELKRKKLDHNNMMEEREQENQLKTCCNTVSDKRLLMFISSFCISMVIIVFSCFQLMRLDDCQSQNSYMGLLSLIVGIWIRSPLS